MGGADVLVLIPLEQTCVSTANLYYLSFGAYFEVTFYTECPKEFGTENSSLLGYSLVF